MCNMDTDDWREFWERQSETPEETKARVEAMQRMAKVRRTDSIVRSAPTAMRTNESQPCDM